MCVIVIKTQSHTERERERERGLPVVREFEILGCPSAYGAKGLRSFFQIPAVQNALADVSDLSGRSVDQNQRISL